MQLKANDAMKFHNAVLMASGENNIFIRSTLYS